MNPTAAMADVVLPVASAFEREGLKIGFDISSEAQSRVQLRPPVVPPPGEARPDTEIIFALAQRLGFGAEFWDGDIDASYRHQLAPIGIGLEELRASPGGVRLPLETRYAKYAEPDPNGTRRALPRRRAKSSSTRKPFSIKATRRCPISRSRRSARHGTAWQHASRWC
jgi:anaerobic selenocysteine-containing dehydrogenase